MRRGTAVAGVVLGLGGSACGRLDFQTTSRDADAAVPDACTFTAFADAQPVTIVNSTFTDFGGFISPDGLTLYFDSDRTGNEELYLTRRESRTAAFGMPDHETALGSGVFDGDQTITADGLDLFFGSARETGGGSCIYTTHRDTPTSMWTAPERLDALCTTDGAGGPYISADGLVLTYNLLLDAKAEGQLMVSHRATRTDAFAAGMAIAELQSGPHRGFPAMTSDDLTILFETYNNTNRLQLFWATRPDATSPFGAPTPIPGIDDGANDGDPSITADGRELYYASDKAGTNDIWVATRSCE